MSDHDPVQEAAEALIAYGCKVEPLGDDFDFWIVDGKGMSNGDLLALATRLGLMDSSSSRLQ